MRYEFRLPDLAEGMVEGEIVSWLVAAGDVIAEEQPVVEVMTDKATVVIPSPTSGTMAELLFEPGDLAEVGQVLFVVETAGEKLPTKKVEKAAPTQPAVACEAAAPSVPASQPASPVQAVASKRAPRGSGGVLATPATRKLAREMDVDLLRVHGTGPGGRVTKADVRAHQGEVSSVAALSASPQAVVAPPASTPAVSVTPAEKPAPVRAPAVTREPGEAEERIRVRGLRRAIYESMTRSKSTAAHFTFVEEIDCSQLVAARRRLKPAAEAHGVRFNYLPFIAKATLLALRSFPKMNASMDDEAGEIVIKRYYHLGFAAATTAGLMVPVLRDADQMTLLELAQGVADLAVKAREGRLAPSEAKGSTFTITSLGKLGGVLATPIINYPEVAIMGIHKMDDRAVVRDGKIVIRPMMNLSLSFDHRVIDGNEGAEFAQRVKYYLEDPELMLLEMV